MKIIFIYPFKSKLCAGPIKWLPLSSARLVSVLKIFFSNIDFYHIDLENSIEKQIKKSYLSEDFNIIAKNIIDERCDVPSIKKVLKYRYFFDEIIKHFKLEKYDHYFFCLYGWNKKGIQANLWLAKYLRYKFGSNKKIFFGGAGVDKFSRNKKIFNYLKQNHKQKNPVNFIDSFIFGFSGEWATKALIKDIIQKKNLKKIYTDKEFIKKEGVKKYYKKRLNFIPDFDNFIDFNYFSYSYKNLESFYRINTDIKKKNKKVLFIPYFFSSGCFFGRCAYCPSSGTDFNYVCKPTEEVVKDLKTLKNKYKSSYFIFYNDNFNNDLNYTKKLLKSIINHRLNILFTDSFNLLLLDNEIISLMKKAGIFRVDLGLSTCDSVLQEKYDMLIKDNSLLKKIKFLSKEGIWIQVNMIGNFPFQYSSNKDHEVLEKYIDYIDSVTYNDYLLYRFSRLGKNYKNYNLSLVSRDVKGLNDNYTVTDKPELAFLENNFKGTIEERLEIFKQIHDNNINFFKNNNLIINDVNLYLLGFLYKEWGFKKDKIKKKVIEAWKNIKN